MKRHLLIQPIIKQSITTELTFIKPQAMRKNYLILRASALALMLMVFLTTFTVKATDYHVTDLASFNNALTSS